MSWKSHGISLQQFNTNHAYSSIVMAKIKVFFYIDTLTHRQTKTNQSTEVLTLLCMAEDFQMKGQTNFFHTESKMYTVHFFLIQLLNSSHNFYISC